MSISYLILHFPHFYFQIEFASKRPKRKKFKNENLDQKATIIKCWPNVTSNDLEIIQIVYSIKYFSDQFWLLWINIEIWPFNEIFDLEWPKLTSKVFLKKIHGKSFVFMCYLTAFAKMILKCHSHINYVTS